MPVTFDGDNLLIILESAVNTVDAQVDLYSDWKEWVKLSDNAKFPQAFRTIGGDPLGGGVFAGAYFFLNNIDGWRIRPPEEDINIQIDGNLFAEDTTLPIFVPTVGNFNTILRLNSSSLTQLASGGGSTVWSEAEKDQVIDLLEADEVFIDSTGKKETRRRGTAVKIIPDKDYIGPANSDSSLIQE